MSNALCFRTLFVVFAVAGAACSTAPQTGTPALPPRTELARQYVPGSVLPHGLNLAEASNVPNVPQPWSLPHRWPSATGQREVLLIADPDDNQVLMYDPSQKNPKPEGSITTGIDYAVAIAVDQNSTVYIANLMGGSANKGSIAIYKSGATKPSRTITEGLVNPYSLAVDTKGNVFVTNLDSNTIVGYLPAPSRHSRPSISAAMERLVASLRIDTTTFG